MTTIEIILERDAPLLDRHGDLHDADDDDKVIYRGTAFACALKGACRAWQGFTEDEREILDEVAESCEVPVEHAGLFIAAMTALRAIYASRVSQLMDADPPPRIGHDALMYDNFVNLIHTVRQGLDDIDDQHILCQLGAEQFDEVRARLTPVLGFTARPS